MKPMFTPRGTQRAPGNRALVHPCRQSVILSSALLSLSSSLHYIHRVYYTVDHGRGFDLGIGIHHDIHKTFTYDVMTYICRHRSTT